MKKLLLLTVFVLLSLVGNAKKQKSYYYDGIELHNVKGWTIKSYKDTNLTMLTCTRSSCIVIIQKLGLPQNFNAERCLEGIVEGLFENSLTNKKSLKIKKVEEVAEGYVNNIPAKYVDIMFAKKDSQRIYVFELQNKLFMIYCTEKDKIDKIMEKCDPILSSFTYMPESNPYDNLF